MAQKWRCGNCGYIHEGPEPPSPECPRCGASKEQFEPVEDQNE